MRLDDFAFTGNEIFLLANIQYRVLRKESKSVEVKKMKKVFKSDEEINAHKIKLLEAKKKWLNQWRKVTWKLLNASGDEGYSNQIFDDMQLQEKIDVFIKDSSEEKKTIFALECATINAYYTFPDEKQQSKLSALNPFHNKTKEIRPKLDEKIYIQELAEVLNLFKFRSKELASMRRMYFSYLKDTSNELKSVWEKYGPWFAAIAGIALLALFAPYIAAALGNAMGFSGVAAYSAGLALLGGGSIAAGGLGMAGGYAVLLGGGALLGFMGGKAVSEEYITELSNENLIISSAKLLTVVKTLAKDMEINFKDAYRLLDSLRQMQFKFEENIDRAVCLTQELNRKEYEKYKKNAQITDFSRRTILEILVDYKK